MKRSPLPPRSAPLRSGEPARGGTIKRKTRIKQVNPERQAKRRIRQAAKHRAYMRSETRRDVDIRADGRCEAAVRMDAGFFEVQPRDFLSVVSPTSWFCITLKSEDWRRCENRSHLQHHHLTYARYGGNELPEDMLKVCKRCHEWLDAQHPTRGSHLRQTGRARQETDNG